MKKRLYLGLGLYAGTSYYLLHHPELVHDTKQRRLKMPVLEKEQLSHYVIAHRGGSMENPENTLQAFSHAVAIGAHMLETDVRITKDGIILVCHDDNFHRLCGPTAGHGLVKDTLLKDIPLFREKLPIHFSKGQLYHVKDTDQRCFSTLD
jgi:glycerophosphoryl diester phosphodiesterase